MDFLFNLLIWGISIAAVVCLAVWLYILNQGDARFEFLVNERSPLQLTEMTKESATFTTSIPFVNSGPQDGTIIDLFPRCLLPQEHFDKATVESYAARTTDERSDGYWEAAIVPKKTGGIVKLTVKFTAKEDDITTALKEMVDMPVSLICQIVSRSKWYLQKNDLVVTKEEIAQEMEKMSGSLRGQISNG